MINNKIKYLRHGDTIDEKDWELHREWHELKVFKLKEDNRIHVLIDTKTNKIFGVVHNIETCEFFGE